MGSIEEKGFISEKIQPWIKKHREEYQEWFRLSENINSLGQKLMLSHEPPVDDGQKTIVMILFSRILSHFQGIVLLTERGMVAEASSLLRGMLDATFSIVASSKDKEIAKAFVYDDFFQRMKNLRSIIALPKETKKKLRVKNKNLEKQIEEIQKEIDNKQIKPMTSEFLAQKAGMLGYYNTYFVLFSSSIHSRVRDLEEKFFYDEEGERPNRLRWGPDVTDLDDILEPACDILFKAAHAVLRLFQDSKLDEQFQYQWILYEKLIGKK